MNLFKKAAIFTDIHFGRRGNDRTANKDNGEFIDWFIEESKKQGAETCIFGGDWHDNRYNIHLSTLHHSHENLTKLGKAFEKVYILIGNHDLLYRDKRDISSIPFGSDIENVIMVTEPMEIGNVALIPWLINNEWKSITDYTSKYMFGHFELPSFIMTGNTEMQDHGKLNKSHFKNQDYVFSGHFHKRQVKDNIIYLGNVFPFDYSDSGDDDRGACFLEWGETPYFKKWPDAPSFKTVKLSELLANIDIIATPKSTLKVALDYDVSFEDGQYIKDLLYKHKNVRKIDLIPISNEYEEAEFSEEIIFQSIDQIVLAGIDSLSSDGLSVDVLKEIYGLL